MTTPLETFRHWAQIATYGDELCYQTPKVDRRPELFAHAMKLSDAGLVFLFQRRRPDGLGFDHIARRTKVEAHLILDRISESVKAPKNPQSDEAILRRGRPRKAA